MPCSLPGLPPFSLYLIAIILAAAGCMPQEQELPTLDETEVESSNQSNVETPDEADEESLSVQAARLEMGMSRADVIRVLGPADWASIPGDGGELALPDLRIGLELRWNNPGCTPVVAAFDQQKRLNGWDEGRGYCGDDAALFNPDDSYSCLKSDRQKLCALPAN